MRVSYEIHVTVPVDRESDLRLLAARHAIARHGLVKVCSFANLGGNGWSSRDVMTSWTGELHGQEEARISAERQAVSISRAGIPVLRWKIETVPWHSMGPDSYHETHVRVAGSHWRPDDCLLSVAEPSLARFLTLRTSGGYSHHLRKLDRALVYMNRMSVTVLSVDTELVLIDSKPEHDQDWVASSIPQRGEAS